MMSIRKAVLPVAGLGTRFLPATKTVPKEMIPILEKPLIHYAVEEALAAGIEEIVFVTGRGKGAIEDYFDHAYELEDILKTAGKDTVLTSVQSSLLAPGRLSFIRQMSPQGLGHAIWCARHFVGNEPFAVLLPDDLIIHQRRSCLAQMVDVYAKTGGNIVAALDVEAGDTEKYGILEIQDTPCAIEHSKCVSVKGMVEKPSFKDAPSQTAIIGRYILQPEVFEHLEKQDPGQGGEVQITDALVPLCQTQAFHGVKFEGERFDCGTPDGYVLANVYLALQRPDLSKNIQEPLKNLLKEWESKKCV